MRPSDVLLLSSLVAANQQYCRGFTNKTEVHAVAWSIVDPKLRDTATDRSCVSGIAERQSSDTDKNLRPCSSVAKIPEPVVVRIGLTNFNHQSIVSHTIHRDQALAKYLLGTHKVSGDRAHEVSGRTFTGFEEPEECERA